VYIISWIDEIPAKMLDVFISVWEVKLGCITIVVICSMTVDTVLFVGNLVDITVLKTVEETRRSPKRREGFLSIVSQQLGT
jgi:hypothetical protein